MPNAKHTGTQKTIHGREISWALWPNGVVASVSGTLLPVSDPRYKALLSCRCCSIEESGLPWCLSGKESACPCRRYGFNPWVRKIPWRRKRQPTLVLLPGKSHGQRSLAGYSSWHHKRVRQGLQTKWQQKRFYLPFNWLLVHPACHCSVAGCGKSSAARLSLLSSGLLHGLSPFTPFSQCH